MVISIIDKNASNTNIIPVTWVEPTKSIILVAITVWKFVQSSIVVNIERKNNNANIPCEI